MTAQIIQFPRKADDNHDVMGDLLRKAYQVLEVEDMEMDIWLKTAQKMLDNHAAQVEYHKEIMNK